VLQTGSNEIQLDPTLSARARRPIERMLAFTAQHQQAQTTPHLMPHLGAT
jgi:quinolinate synthase